MALLVGLFKIIRTTEQAMEVIKVADLAFEVS